VAAVKRGTGIIVTTALIAISAVLLVVLVVQLSSSDPEDTNIGDEMFEVGDAQRLVNRTPLLFQDLRGGDLHVWVNHIGDDPDSGWVTFSATVRRGCFIERRRDTFVDCNGKKYPEDGEPLQEFHTEVDSEGRVVVDFTRG
jgi:hypothetical protein